jgi:putative ABC transport system permease protein
MFLDQNGLAGTKLLTVRFTPGNGQKAKNSVTGELGNFIPNDPFEFKYFKVIFFMDQAISFWQSLKRLFMFFAIVTLIVSSMGLFGLILFTTKRRTKEMGVRKVLGSSVRAIYVQLSVEVVGLLGFAVLVASPGAWAIYRYMPGAYKEPLTASVFILAIVIIALVAFITISYHVLKVAVQNPVEALRYE